MNCITYSSSGPGSKIRYIAAFFAPAIVVGRANQVLCPPLRDLVVYERDAATVLDAGQLAQKVSEYPLSNAKLLKLAEKHRPPQSWYEEEKDLF